MSATALLPTGSSSINYEALPDFSNPIEEKIEIVISSSQLAPQDAYSKLLPGDILLMIFDRVLQGSLSSIKDYQQRVALQKVCKRWHNLLTKDTWEKRFWNDCTPINPDRITTREKALNTLGRTIVLMERKRIAAEKKIQWDLKINKIKECTPGALSGAFVSALFVTEIVGLVLVSNGGTPIPAAVAVFGTAGLVLGVVMHNKCKKT